MEYYDLAIAWDWEYDRYFIYKIEEIFQEKGLKTYRIEYYNAHETLCRLKKKELRFGCFLDRADEEEEFIPIKKYLEKNDAYYFNHPKMVKRANDKATMHLELITGGINVPYSIILSPYSQRPDVEISSDELSGLGVPFIIKPANDTGGSVGVFTGAHSLNEVLEARTHQKNAKYLIQEKIHPKILNNKRAWFRGFFAFDKVILTWWDDFTHRYEIVTREEEEIYRLYSLRKIMASIRSICKLDFFSSEICIAENNKSIVIDYVNDVCDMRPQSMCLDGVPDQIINQIITRLSDFLRIRRD